VRRCWRFGQTRPVVVDVVTTEGEADVLGNLKRKADAADVMFSDDGRTDARRCTRAAPVAQSRPTPTVLAWRE
jgi:hypothetical protein